MAERHLVVVENIPFGGVLAYTKGQTITEQAVNDNGWQDYVAAAGTKAAAEVQAAVTGRDAAEFQTTGTRSAKNADSSTSTKTQEG